MKLKSAVFLTFFTTFIFLSALLPVDSRAATITGIRTAPTQVGLYEKYEVKFDVSTSAKNLFFEYSTSTPQGVGSRTGITVEGEIRSPSGRVATHPAFYMTEAERFVSGTTHRFQQKSESYWALRFSPQELGQHTIVLKATDADGSSTYSVGTVNVVSSSNPGFVKVSQSDSRYFEFSNRSLFWPIGPAWLDNKGKSTNPAATDISYAQYVGTGVNFDRPWMAGWGAYSGNWARWISSAERLGNEGFSTRFDTQNVYPGSEMSYPLWYNGNPDSNASDDNIQNGFRMWVSGFSNGPGQAQLKANTCYQIKLVYKTVNVTGPRNSSSPYGLTVRHHAWINGSTPNAIDTDLRRYPQLTPHFTGSNEWTTYQTVRRTTSADSDFSIYLDNVTGGQAYINEFSVREVVNPTNVSTCPTSGYTLGGELIRNSKSDIHTYVEQTAAAAFDWLLDDAKRGGVYLKFVVHDKNDPIFNRLYRNGSWTSNWQTLGDGYFQPFSTKAGWLRRQWYRYVVARWGYSTNVHSFELVNEGPPNEDPANSGSSPHWAAAQEFASYIDSIDYHRHLATTSFWCCWRPRFWSGSSFGNIDYADLHEYSGNSSLNELGSFTYLTDVAEGMSRLANMFRTQPANKPVVIAELGLSEMPNWWGPSMQAGLNSNNPGIWYRHIIWSGIGSGSFSAPNYWFTDHVRFINREQIATVFWNFVKNLDVNRGGYVDLAANVSNSNLRVVGQKNTSRGIAYFWAQNRSYGWANTNPAAVTSTVTVSGLPASTDFNLQRYDTSTGASTTQTVRSSQSGSVDVTITSLVGDVAYKITPQSVIGIPSTTPSATPVPTVNPTPTATPVATVTPTQTPVVHGNGDANQDGLVNQQDLRTILSSMSVATTSALDQYKDGVVNALDFAYVSNILTTAQTSTPSPTVVPTPVSTPTPTIAATPTPTTTINPIPSPTVSPTPTTPITSVSGEWSQHGFNAQRTSYSPQEVAHPWRWMWSWNGPDASGRPVSGKTVLPRNVQPVTGGGRVYVAAGTRGVFALDENTGSQIWQSNPGGSMNSTVAYDSTTNSVFSYSTNGTLYKLNAATGASLGQYQSSATSTLPLPPLVLSDRVVFVSGNQAIALNKSTMQVLWTYDAGSTIHTPPSYSQVRNLVIVASSDLNVHGINNSNAARVWRSRVASDGAYAEVQYGWPVVSDANNLVLIKVRRDWNTLWTWSPWPTTNAAILSNLQSQPNQQALYALSLTDGSIPFITNVGHGGYGDNNYMPMGPQPAIKRLANGQEVAYTVIRGKTGVDGRWDSNFGELILNNNTVPGYQAGFVRWISDPNNPPFVTDEQPNVSVMGNYVLGGHWMIGYALRINDRSDSRGAYTNPITTTVAPYIVASASNVPLSTSHYSGSTLTNDGDARDITYGFYIYYNQPRIYDSYWSGYASYVASNNKLYFRSSDGAIIAFSSGSPTADSQVVSTVASSTDSDPFESQAVVVSPQLARHYQGKLISTTMTVAYAHNNGKQLVLSVNDPHVDYFKVIIPSTVIDQFEENPLHQYGVGSTITVSGVVDMYQGDPAVIINSPSQIMQK